MTCQAFAQQNSSTLHFWFFSKFYYTAEKKNEKVEARETERSDLCYPGKHLLPAVLKKIKKVEPLLKSRLEFSVGLEGEKTKKILASFTWTCSNKLPQTATLLAFMGTEYLDLVKAEKL